MSIKMMSRHACARMAVAIVATSAPAAWAKCDYSPRMQIGQYSVDFGKVVVDNSRPIGTVLATRRVDFGGDSSRWVAQCGSGAPVRFIAFRGVKGEVVLNNSVVRAYSTNVPGVGYQVQVEGGSGRPAFPTNYNFPSLSSGYVSRTQRWDSIRIDLIKTAARVGNGPLEGGLYGQVYANPNPEDFYVRLSVAGGTILSPSCTVAEKSRNFTVRMGRVPSSDFNGIGSTSRETPFNVEIACQAAPGTIQSTVSMTMDATRPATQPGVLDINPVGPTQVIAGGVGIQLLDGQRKPVEFGKEATVGASKDGNYVVPFVARYMQTGAQLQPGIANGTATFTLTHQ